MNANDVVCYACGRTLGEHRVGTLECQNSAQGQALFGPGVFTPLPVREVEREPTGGEWFRFLHPGEREEWEGDNDGE